MTTADNCAGILRNIPLGQIGLLIGFIRHALSPFIVPFGLK